MNKHLGNNSWPLEKVLREKNNRIGIVSAGFSKEISLTLLDTISIEICVGMIAGIIRKNTVGLTDMKTLINC